MSRLQTPDIMGDILGFNDRTPQVLRWDYSQAGTNAAKVQEYAAHIKRSEERATWEIIAAGEAFIAVKALLPHGQWEDWLDVEFGLTDRTAQRIMSVATAFGGKSDTVSLLSTSVLYLLAAPSTPKAARDQVIDVAATQPKPVTQAQAKAIIAEHKPRTVSPTPAQRPISNSEMAMINQGIVDHRAELAAARATKDRQFYSAVDAARDKYEPAYQVNGAALPAWVTTDVAGWRLTIDERTDPAELAAELQRVGVGSDWMEALWNAYMGGEA